MASIEVTTPTSPPAESSSRSPSPTRTNTLVLTQLPVPFFHHQVMDALRDHFETYGSIHTWAPIRAFARVILVYRSEDDAEEAKVTCDGLIIDATSETAQFTLRVFRGTHTSLTPSTPPTGPNSNYLQPPAIEKNFLISPPGSPPVGWEPIKEDPPNVTPLADDLISALRKLELSRRATHNGIEVLLDPEDGAGIGVYVEDCDVRKLGVGEDSDEEDKVADWDYGMDNPSRLWKPMPTALPPMPVEG